MEHIKNTAENSLAWSVFKTIDSPKTLTIKRSLQFINGPVNFYLKKIRQSIKLH